jgi:MFS family permease
LKNGDHRVSGIGGYIFAYANSILLLEIARVIIGFGAAFAFISTVSLCRAWFSDKAFGMLVSISFALGTLASAFSGTALETLVSDTSWHILTVILGTFSIVLAILSLIFLRNRPDHLTKPIRSLSIFAELKSSLAFAFKKKTIYYASIWATLFFAPTAIFAGLWAVPYTQAIAPDSKLLALVAPAMLIGNAIGTPLSMWLYNLTKREVLISNVSIVISIVCFICIAAFPHQPPSSMLAFSFATGIFGGASIFAFVWIGERFPVKMTGIAIAILNLIQNLGIALAMQLVGLLLDKNWGHYFLHGIKPYSIGDYQIALFSLPVFLIIALVITKNTFRHLNKPTPTST